MVRDYESPRLYRSMFLVNKTLFDGAVYDIFETDRARYRIDEPIYNVDGGVSGAYYHEGGADNTFSTIENGRFLLKNQNNFFW